MRFLVGWPALNFFSLQLFAVDGLAGPTDFSPAEAEAWRAAVAAQPIHVLTVACWSVVGMALVFALGWAAEEFDLYRRAAAAVRKACTFFWRLASTGDRTFDQIMRIVALLALAQVAVVGCW